MVEWKKLGEFTTHQKAKNKNHVTENAYSITQAGLIPTKSFFKEKTNVTSSDTSGYYIVEKEWFVYSPSRIDVGSISYLKDEGPVIVSPIDVVFSVDKNICLPSFLLGYFFTYKGKKDLLKNREGVEGMGRRNLPYESIKDIEIPIPPLAEQTRIVGILDTFTAAIENLKEQIALRRKQFEYYRDQLLDLEGKEGVEMKQIREIFDTRNGYTPSTNNDAFWDNGTLPWFKMEDIRINGRILKDSILHITPKAVKGKGLFKANSIILATSATIGEHALITVEHLCNQRFTNFYPKKIFEDKINMKYVYYYMFKVDEWCKQHINQGGFASVDMGGLYSLFFPVPSLQDQQRIVSILDTFEASISNLEAQLEQREKQYEYYRNKLLTFE